MGNDMKICVLALAVWFPTLAFAQVATSSGWEINGYITLNGHETHYDHQLLLQKSGTDPYDQTLPMSNFDDGEVRFNFAQTRTLWTGEPAPYVVQASSTLTDWELHLDLFDTPTLFFQLSFPNLTGYAQVAGTCPSDLLSTTFLNVDQLKLYANGVLFNPPFTPDENTFIDLTTDNDFGASDGNVILRETARNGAGNITMIGIDLNITFAEADGTMAAIAVQIAQNAASLDCSGLSVELESWEVE
jgi:hypothetical protein